MHDVPFNKTAELMRSLLRAGDLPVSPGAHRYALDLGERLGDTELLVMLAERRDLPVDCKTRLAQMSDARVRSAYLSRPDLPAAELRVALGSERRVTVLAALAQNETATDEVLAALVEQMRDRDSVRLAESLLKCRSGAAHLQALLFLAGKANTRDWRSTYRLEERVSNLPDEVLNEAARVLPGWACEPLLTRAGIDAPGRLRLLELGLTRVLSGTSRSGPSRNPQTVTREIAVLPDLQLEVMAELYRLLLAAEQAVTGWREWAPDILADLESRSGGVLGGALAPDVRAGRVAALTLATSPDAAPAALADAAGDAARRQDRVLAAALAAHPATPAAATAALVPLLDVEEWVAQAWAAQTGPGRDPARVALLGLNPDLLSGADEEAPCPLDAFEDLAGSAAELVALWAPQVYNRSAPAAGALLALQRRPAGQAVAAAMAMPWQVLSDIATVRYFERTAKEVSASMAILAAQESVLGDHMERWATFERLEAKFTGSGEDLFAAVAAITC